MNNKIEKIIEKLNTGLDFKEDGRYMVGRVETYEDFLKVYNKLEKSLDLFKNSLASFMTEDDCHVQYETEDGLILELVAIFDEDDYTLNISDDEITKEDK